MVLKYICFDIDTKEKKQFLFNCLTDDDRTVLDVSCIQGKTEISEHLMMFYQKLLNVSKQEGYHAVHYAALSGLVECFKKVLKYSM